MKAANKQVEQSQARVGPVVPSGEERPRDQLSLREMFPDRKFMDYEEGMRIARKVVAENREALEELSRT